MSKVYKSPVDGAALVEVKRPGPDGEVTVYRDQSTGTEYSEEFLKSNKVETTKNQDAVQVDESNEEAAGTGNEDSVKKPTAKRS